MKKHAMKNRLVILTQYFRYNKSEANSLPQMLRDREVAVNPHYVSRIEHRPVCNLESYQSHTADFSCIVFFGPNQYVHVNGTVQELMEILSK
jgi:hypothetical protein